MPHPVRPEGGRGKSEKTRKEKDKKDGASVKTSAKGEKKDTIRPPNKREWGRKGEERKIKERKRKGEMEGENGKNWSKKITKDRVHQKKSQAYI